AERLEVSGVIRNSWIFRKYLVWKGMDKKINIGTFKVDKPVTVARIAEVLAEPGVTERTITIIPGWDLRDLADYFATERLIGKADFFTEVVGVPAHEYSLTRQLPSFIQELDIYSPKIRVMADKPWFLSLEGYLAPDTYRIYKNAGIEDTIKKLLEQRDRQFTDKMYADISAAGRSVHEMLTMASILEREVRSPGDKAKVADIFWRRHDAGMGLQADSTVHYAVGKKGDVFTTAEDRDSLNSWNTYKYPKLPPGPISNPGIESIMAAIYSEKNDYWYFLTTLDTGEVKYARTLAEQNANAAKFLKNR
ncbi:MAG: endolytic transglycosylase MltG, partial [Patescibacteria group bacterium]